jgi:hypothetical protein
VLRAELLVELFLHRLGPCIRNHRVHITRWGEKHDSSVLGLADLWVVEVVRTVRRRRRRVLLGLVTLPRAIFAPRRVQEVFVRSHLQSVVVVVFVMKENVGTAVTVRPRGSRAPTRSLAG